MFVTSLTDATKHPGEVALRGEGYFGSQFEGAFYYSGEQQEHKTAALFESVVSKQRVNNAGA